MPIAAKITSDFIRPWCLIGERRLFRAIDTLPPGYEVEAEWLPFELNPDMPKGGMDRKVYRSLKFGSWERSQALDAHTTVAGRATESRSTTMASRMHPIRSPRTKLHG